MKQLANQQGMALLMVLVIVALLSALLTEFSFSTLVDLRGTETFRDRTKAYYLARGGVEAARMILQDDQNAWDHPSEFWGDDLARIPAGDGDVNLRIRDLSGRINLNSVADLKGNKLSGYHRFAKLCEEVLLADRAQAEQLADALVNWFNADLKQVTADDSHYAGLQPPYSRKGGKLDTLNELELLRDFSSDIVRQLKPYVRVVGDEKINVNTASGEVLYAWQHSDAEGIGVIIFDRQDIEALLSLRRKSPYRKLADLAEAEGIGDRWASAWRSGSIDVKGTVFQVNSTGRINQGTRLVEAVILKNGNQLLSLKVE